MASLDLININKIYPNGVQAVFDLNLHIKDKEFIVLIGPSGCGKSTTLRMIAGLEDISFGEFYIDEKRMNDVSPKDRGIAMVFQSYALYPHMTVFDNMAFALQLRRVEREDIIKRVNAAAKILGLETLLERYPRQLSGGQCQRVALGRAIVRNASVFLMDEPLSNLDAKLRVTMRGELIKLSQKLGCTTVYVTHDQIEAMTMADRIVVMKDGEVQQVGTPEEVYETPTNIFVGGFIGTPPMNFIHGVLDSNCDFVSTKGNYKLSVGSEIKEALLKKGYENKKVILGIRPEDISDNLDIINTNPDCVVDIVVEFSELLGSNTNVYTTIDDDSITASLNSRDDLHRGSPLKLVFDMNHCHLFDAESELRIL
jgi:multiple sugar transport system ATP-binding protein